MILTIELPDALASQFVTELPEAERNAFLADAIADELALRQKKMDEADARWLAALNAKLDPEKEPERDAAECKAIVEKELADMDAVFPPVARKTPAVIYQPSDIGTTIGVHAFAVIHLFT